MSFQKLGATVSKGCRPSHSQESLEGQEERRRGQEAECRRRIHGSESANLPELRSRDEEAQRRTRGQRYVIVCVQARGLVLVFPSALLLPVPSRAVTLIFG